MAVYRIVNWAVHFENNRTRELKSLAWVPIPNKLDGDGYTEMVSRKDGAEIYGAWIACVLVASKCDPRGTLLRDTDRPHDCTSLSRITRLPEKAFKAMFDVAARIGWIEVCDDLAPSCDLVAPSCLEGKGREGNRREGKGKNNGVYSSEFEEFWTAFPKGRKTGKGNAYAAYRKAIKDTDPEVIIAAAAEYAASDVGNGQYVKGPTPWLNGRCWEDDRAAWTRQDDQDKSRRAARLTR